MSSAIIAYALDADTEFYMGLVVIDGKVKFSDIVSTSEELFDYAAKDVMWRYTEVLPAQVRSVDLGVIKDPTQEKILARLMVRGDL